jgi:cation:H+ antiporter
MSRWEAVTLLVLFLVQFAIPDPDARIWLAGAYLLIAIAILIAQRREIIRIARCAFKIGAERDDYQRAGPSRSAP